MKTQLNRLDRLTLAIGILHIFSFLPIKAQQQKAHNPIIYADVPDLSIIRVGNNYYMSSTTMHMSPGLPIMKSTDLVNWKLIGYAYDTLGNMDELNLRNGKNTYGRGSWASSLRYHNGKYYVTTFSQTTGKTYIYSTKDIEKSAWKGVAFKPMMHDHSLFFDDDGKAYLVYGSGKIRLVELNSELTGIASGSEQVIIENASLPTSTSGSREGLPAEGSQLFKIKGRYYLFNITWPAGGQRSVVIHRADKITGPWEGKTALQDKGVAQGGLIDMPDGRWFAYLFRDNGAVGRIPYLVPVKWENGWPVLGDDGKVPMALNLTANQSLSPGIVASDEFNRGLQDASFPLAWQWNHQPDNELWSLKGRKGFLRLTTGIVNRDFLQARNTLTQRTFGPTSSACTSVDVSSMKDGDFAGLCLLQKDFGLLGVKINGTKRTLVMVNASGDNTEEVAHIALNKSTIYLKADCNFTDRKDIARFYYSLDGKSWNSIGTPLQMKYTLPHFMGYRFGLFNYATKEPGGYADFDYFRISDEIMVKE
ncbi:glycoside hydrolase 43 family protein [[Flexibacter] sp. ATCC 35208]|uniref:glycoside hydrolase family 43 protein n=1 Tax=[Flexibacter] sp. ATCC 35208 TaxID=1936242 RepID=UPI0009D05CFB|nr:glycoside hydrolase 43 family protein [[Flexibacter] sp. ATCC 35208]OMP75502.1 glycoside hydrolase [[Flexibacter] sp. ATCC 35208]